MTVFKKATKTQSKLRMALYGVSGSGKTYSALAIATGIGGRIAVIDTERGSAAKYAGKYDFDVLDMQPPYSPEAYVKAIHAAEIEGYEILIIDSLTHAWSGSGGALEMVDNAAKRSQSNNSYIAWRDVTPEHNRLIDAMLQSKCHIIATMRSKAEYVLEEDSRGKKVPKKKAMAPIQRDGMEYEFDVVAEMTADNEMIVQKSRCEALTGRAITKPNGEVSALLKVWLSDGAPAKPATPPLTSDDQHALNQRRLGRDQDNIDLSEPAVPPEPNKKQLALSRLSKHARGVGELANQAASSGDSIRANNLIAAVNRARRLYGDMNATISDLHKMADELKALEQPAEVPQM